MSLQPFPSTKSGASGNAPQLPAARVDEIRQRLRKHIDDSEDSNQGKIAKRVGYSSATIGLFLSAKYDGDSASVAEAAESYLDLYDQQKAIGNDAQFVRTAIAKKINRAITLAEATRKIAVIAGLAGCGKTRAIYAYLETRPRSVLIRCSPDLNTKWALLSELLWVLTKDDSRRKSPSHARRAIVRALEGTDRTIVVDEAQFLSAEGVEELRCIAEQCQVALILAGNDSVYERGPGGLGATAHQQFSSRVVAKVLVGADQIKAADIRLIATQFVSAHVVEETLRQLENEAQTHGGYRRVVACLQIAQMLAAPKAPQKVHVLRALQELRQLGGGDE